jgi:prepilin peptidase CpaA
MHAQLIRCLPLLGMLTVAAVIDVRSRRVPNWLTLGLAIAGLIQAGLMGNGLGWAGSVRGLSVGFAVPFIFFAINALGAGDVKLLAAVGAWVGAKPILLIMLAAAVLGGVVALIQSILQRRLALVLGNTALLAANLLSIRRFGIAKVAAMGREKPSLENTIPYGVAISAATVFFVVGRWAGWT